MKKFCPKCQTETIRTSAGKCSPCATERMRKWREANKDRDNANAAEWRKNNNDKAKAACAKYNEANREERNAAQRERRAANPEKYRAMASSYRAANPEKAKESCKKWGEKNLDVKRIHEQNRRAKARLNGGKLSKGIAKKLFALQGGKCPCCGLPLGNDYHLDHIVPVHLGGANVDENIQLLRATCNHQKHSKHPVEFMQSRGFLL